MNHFNISSFNTLFLFNCSLKAFLKSGISEVLNEPTGVVLGESQLSEFFRINVPARYTKSSEFLKLDDLGFLLTENDQIICDGMMELMKKIVKSKTI